MSAVPPRIREVRLGERRMLAERRADGCIVLRAARPLGPYPAKLTERIVHWAGVAPDRIAFAERSGEGWRSLSYGELLQRMRAVGAGLLARGLSAERPLAILSGNDLEHAVLQLGAQYVGIPYAPVSPAYSLLSTDFGRLREVMSLVTPGMVYAAGPAFSRAIEAAVPRGTEVLVGRAAADGLAATASVARASAVEAAHAAVGPDTIAKFLFTSGSTGTPKAVVNTQRMWCANQEMLASMLEYFRDEPPVLVDWAPWHHTAGGNHDFGLSLYHGGSFYLDEGKPLPGQIEHTVRNLKEVAPTWYFNVPKGFEALLPFLRADEALRRRFFSRVKVLWFAGAGVSQPVFDEMKALAVASCGEQVLFLTGFGATETAPLTFARLWDTADASNMGVPPPGVEVKLVPVEGKLEARLRGPHITPGYWRAPGLTAAAFDEEGYYRLGDAFVPADPADFSQGLLYRGRLSEDFKLATGTWVHVGPLRASLIEHCSPLVRDVVIAGAGRDELGALVFPAEGFSREAFRAKLASLAAQATGSSHRVARALVLSEPPSLDAGEMTDKGSINQRAVLARRQAQVEALYQQPPSEEVIWI